MGETGVMAVLTDGAEAEAEAGTTGTEVVVVCIVVNPVTHEETDVVVVNVVFSASEDGRCLLVPVQDIDTSTEH